MAELGELSCDVAVPAVLDRAAGRLEVAGIEVLQASAEARITGESAGDLVLAAAHLIGVSGHLRIAFELMLVRLEDPATDGDMGPMRGTLETVIQRADLAERTLEKSRLASTKAIAGALRALADVRTALGNLLEATFAEDQP